jgi:5-methylcytosine-specific restriction endonuclease McrA
MRDPSRDAPARAPRAPQPRADRAVRTAPTRDAAASRAAVAAPAATPAKRRRRRGGGSGGTASVQLTSHPTGRAAYQETRAWLLAQHGPVCAYCGREFTAAVMTLDHVAPRRGQSAYDRRDNLVLACPGCNAAKRDLAPLAFLLGDRSRAANLLSYGAHLSPMLLDLARSLVSSDTPAPTESERVRFADWAFDDLDGESPYKD